MSMGKNIRNLREERKMTQQATASTDTDPELTESLYFVALLTNYGFYYVIG